MIESEQIVNRIVVIGGGASGALVAAQLLRNAGRVPVDVVVLEPRGVLGRGIAYDTADPAHLLNVPARAMSGFPDEPDHFRQWAGAQPAEFVSRSRYGDYLGELLAAAVTGAPNGSRFLHVRSRAIDIAPGTDRQLRVFDDRGDVYAADHVVIATGHDQPAIPTGIAPELLDAPQVLVDPWDPGGLDSIRPGERVVCVGSGLTFVDVALTVL
ncbi:MAG: FAD/NAD(P)-binding protein, partial [Actinomycetes bacterium]